MTRRKFAKTVSIGAAMAQVGVPQLRAQSRTQVKALVFGHTHDWHHYERDGVQFVNLPPTAWLFKAGRPRGWVDLNLTETGATFELRSLDTKHPEHGQKLDLKWR